MYLTHFPLFLFTRRADNFVNVFRLLRTVSRTEKSPKLLKGNVKTIKNFQPEKITSASDFIRDVKSSFNTSDEKEIEQVILDGDDFTRALEKYDYFYDMHKSEERKFKSLVKKNIIKRKYFKSEIETNLLTYAAKEQIHYLHQLDPIKWTPEVLAESFPISVPGVKKLLKTKFVKKSAEKIIEHDLKVAEKWKILKSGQMSPFISLTTQRLWNEGQLSESYYSGNPNLPTASVNKTKVIEETKNECGEYLTIIKKYIDYRNNSVLKQSKCEEKNIVPRNDVTTHDEKKFNCFPYVGYLAPEELDGQIPSKFVSQMKSKPLSETDVQHHQFLENLKESSFNQKQTSFIEKEYQDWIKRQGASHNITSGKNPYNVKDFFTKIPKYENSSPALKQNESSNHAQLYDDKEHHSRSKYVRSKLGISKKIHKKEYMCKIGKDVYDDDGELLYKLPS